MRILVLCMLALFLAACGTAKTPAPTKGAEFHFKEGEDAFERGLYKEAIASWEKVIDTFYSPELNALAELKIAEAHFMAKDYLEAATAYDSFLKQHPGHERTAQVLFQLGLSYFKQILDMDRDQTATRNTQVTFENFLARYPSDPRAEEARRIIGECRERLAEHELYVGRYYLRAGHLQAAITRLQDIFSVYPEFSQRDHAYFYLGQSHLKAGDRQSAEKTFAALEREFPDSELIPQAHKALAKGS